MLESIEGTIFEKVKDEYYEDLPTEEMKEAMILKVLYMLLAR